MTPLELHPLCALFPKLSPPEFDDLVADIKAHGQRDPITLYAGMILDGGNRYRACVEAGVEPKVTGYFGDESSIPAFVLSKNLFRRHLIGAQRSILTEAVLSWKAHPSHRMPASQQKNGPMPAPPRTLAPAQVALMARQDAAEAEIARVEKIAATLFIDDDTNPEMLHSQKKGDILSPLFSSGETPISPHSETPSAENAAPAHETDAFTMAQRAALAGVDVRTQQRAHALQQKSPELSARVIAGEISMFDAERAAGLRKPRKPRKPIPEEGTPAPNTMAEELAEANGRLTELAAIVSEQETELEAFRMLSEGEQAVAAEIAKLKRELETMTRARDGFMHQNAELIREVKSLRRRLEKGA